VALSSEEAQIGKRIRLVREELGASQVSAARRMLLSRDQLKRIERGEVAVRFFPVLFFCDFTNTNPLWLAFGEPEKRLGFFGVRGGKVSQDLMENPNARFLEIMQTHREIFRSASFFRRPADYSDVNILLTNHLEFGKVGSMNLQKVSFWPRLREEIRKLVKQRGMKSALARDIGVSRQAINALLGRKYAPSAEYALRLSKWVEVAKAQQKKGAGGASTTQPAQKTRKRKSKYEKPKSDQKRK
jgi:DNA-binding XRE family transcriptional regulator